MLHDAGIPPPLVNHRVANEEADLVWLDSKRIIEIDEDPGGGRDGDAGVAGDVGLRDRATKHHQPAVPPPPAAASSRDHLVVAFEPVEAVAGSRTPVAQHGARCRQHSADPQLALGQRRVGQHIDAPMDGSPPTSLDGMPKLVPRPAGFSQLPRSNDVFLLARKRPKLRVHY